MRQDHRLPLVALISGITSGRQTKRPAVPALLIFARQIFEGSEHVGEKAHFRYLERRRRDRDQRHNGFRPHQLL